MSLDDLFVLAPMQRVADAAGLDPKMIVFAAFALASYPLAALVFRAVPRLGRRTMHMANILLGATALFAIVGVESVHIVINSALMYAIMWFVRPGRAHVVVLGASFAYLSVMHVERMIGESHGDYCFGHISTPTMVLSIKLCTLAWNLYDGQRDPKLLTAHQKAYAIPVLPPLLEYYSFVLFFPTAFLGPAFEVKPFLNFADHALQSSSSSSSSKDDQDANTLVNALAPSLKALGLGLAFVVSFVASGQLMPVSFLLTDAILDWDLVRRVLYLTIALCWYRHQYYAGFSLPEGAVMLAGLGYEGVDAHGRTQWNRVRYVRTEATEFSVSAKSFLDHWNIPTQRFLRHQVYERLGDRPKSLRTALTLATSAVWHGYYPGYYFCFFHFQLAIMAHRVLRRRVRPLFVDTATGAPRRGAAVHALYTATSWLMMNVGLNYAAATFAVIHWGDSLRALAAVAYVPAMVEVALIVADKLLPAVPRAPRTQLKTE